MIYKKIMQQNGFSSKDRIEYCSEIDIHCNWWYVYNDFNQWWVL